MFDKPFHVPAIVPVTLSVYPNEVVVIHIERGNMHCQKTVRSFKIGLI
jgi:hypothetical protein